LEVIALIGTSGSGKSHRAQAVAHDTNADLIIDDGLLIQGSRIVDGISAKQQPTKVGAIKTALFTNLDHRGKAQNTLAAIRPHRILILGTSLSMVERITERLGLPVPYRLINIDEVASAQEIRTANYYRKQLGKHVVPVPTVEVKMRFPNTLIESIKIILHRSVPAKQAVFEQSQVRPTFSYLGKIIIFDKVLEDIIKWVLSTFPGVNQAGKVRVISEHGNTMLFVQYVAHYGQPLHVLSREIQAKVKEIVESHTGFNVLAVEVLVTNVVKS
jgi:uncharacterized alkaline shock family protein YloU